jgi:hypothetical protein
VTTTNPRIEMTTKRPPRRVRGGSWGSVRRISTVGMHKRARSGGGFGVVLPSPGGGFFNRGGGGGSSSGKEGHVPVPPVPVLPSTTPKLD